MESPSMHEDRGHVYVRPKIYWNTVIYQTSRTVDLGPDVDVPVVFLLRVGDEIRDGILSFRS